ncbi:hypothetical protein JHL18_16265 [Clostridium sp. YIM B02505]|uniref:Uncharacterized protein n=1 Tax=Clostridium yunnanense TaxID=2800325 RepID=A0ABS1ES93_9CLOT|nr:hypothetical protein [Clostridium yunnanense]MBK1812178.1 hypothetical protein [Clostridium yunnanense]
MARKNRKTNDIQEFCIDDYMEENGLVDGEPSGGNVVKAFSFVSSDTTNCPKDEEIIIKQTMSKLSEKKNISASTEILDNRRLKKEVNGRTPSIDGEGFDINRSYKLRESTARMLNEIKAAHPDVNVYMNTIVDTALRHYYDYVFNKNN